MATQQLRYEVNYYNMTAIADLQTAWETEISGIASTLLKAKATLVLEHYIAALESHAKLTAKSLQSYSIAGRTFTFRDLDKSQGFIDNLEEQLVSLCYGESSSQESVSMNPYYDV